MSAVLLVLIAVAGTLAVLRLGGEAARRAGPLPIGAIVLGGLLTATGRAVVGLPIVLLGVALWYRSRSRQAVGSGTSQVTTPWLRMELDHGTGDLDGEILQGSYVGRRLDDLDDDELALFAGEIAREADRRTRELVETYLDRRAPGWRDGAYGDEASGLGPTPGAGPMSKEKAYEILGLAPGASEAEIREAHRRLMKRAHPDAGGTVERAALLNEAKSVLLGGHAR